MKILNRPMFRMGGPIKEGIMNGIQEPRQRYAKAGDVFKQIAEGYQTEPQISQPLRINQQPRGDVLQGAAELGIGNPYKDNSKVYMPFAMNKTVTKPTNFDISEVDQLANEVERIDPVEPLTELQKAKIGKTFIGNEKYRQKVKELEAIEKAKNLKSNADGTVTTGGKSPFNYTLDNVIKDKGKIDDTENTPLTKKERTNNILEMLGYDKAKKNALYDAMIKAGQRVSRTGLGADNLVSDVIQDTSTSYDKPEKLREAANLMDVQQQLKLDQIDASKTNKNQEDLDFYTKQFGGGEAGRKKALNFLTKQASSSVEAYLTTKKSTGSGLDGVKGAIEWMISNGDIKEGENRGEINKKKFDGLSDFLKDPEGFAKRGPGVYQLSGMVVRINADGTTETVQSFGTIDEKTSSWFSK